MSNSKQDAPDPRLFTGKELFVIYSHEYGGNNKETAEREWEESIGKNKKKAWNTLAGKINAKVAGLD